MEHKLKESTLCALMMRGSNAENVSHKFSPPGALNAFQEPTPAWQLPAKANASIGRSNISQPSL